MLAQASARGCSFSFSWFKTAPLSSMMKVLFELLRLHSLSSSMICSQLITALAHPSTIMDGFTLSYSVSNIL